MSSHLDQTSLVHAEKKVDYMAFEEIFVAGDGG